MATFDEIYEKIKEYPTIILHRHTSPDPDAIGSQAGLARSLRLAFPDKKILCAGENDEGDLIWINKMDEVKPEDYKGALVITTDTANTPRISNKEYPTIILHRHTSPDPDAIGSQAGLARSLRLAFPDKKILCAGENDEGDLIWINKMDEVKPEDYKGALVITTDTANTPRISN